MAFICSGELQQFLHTSEMMLCSLLDLFYVRREERNKKAIQSPTGPTYSEFPELHLLQNLNLVP